MSVSEASSLTGRIKTMNQNNAYQENPNRMMDTRFARNHSLRSQPLASLATIPFARNHLLRLRHQCDYMVV